MHTKLYLIFFLFLLSVPVCTQELKVEKIVLLEKDHEAEKVPKYDGNKQLCALLKVYIDNLPGITFNSSYIIDKKNISYTNGYYNVYVVGGINSIELKHNDYLPAPVNFRKDFQIDIQGGKTYGVYLKTSGIIQKKTQTIVFNMIPRIGTININGKENMVDKGVLQIELAPGKYSYTAHSTYYQEKKGEFEVTDISESKIIPLKLKAYTAGVKFECNVPTAVLYVDNKRKGTPGIVDIPLGKHKIRVVAEDWKDHIQELFLEKEDSIQLNITMEPKPYIPVIITCNGSGVKTLYVDNKEVPEWKNDGSPIKIKQGKHLITITCDEEKDFNSKEKIVRIDKNTKKIELKF